MNEKRKQILGKLGQGHVEMILSFAVFAGFVVVMLFFLNPAKENSVNYASMDVAENLVLDNLSIDYRYIGLILNSPVAPSACFSINNTYLINGTLLVLDEGNHVRLSNNDLSNKKINILGSDFSNNRFYKLYFSEAMNHYPSPLNCPPLPVANYSYGVMTLESSVLWENIEALNKSYMEDYAGLKKNLQVSEDFEFVVYNLNLSKVLFDTTAVHKLKTSLVISRDIPLRIVNKNATQSDVMLNIRVW
jgi:hypothetical protein